MNTYTASVLHTLTEAGFLAEKIDNLWALFSLTGDEMKAIMYSTTLGSVIRKPCQASGNGASTMTFKDAELEIQ